MADNLGDDRETKVVAKIFIAPNSTSYADPTSLWLGLCSADPTDSAISEFTIGTNNYARKQIAFGSASSGAVQGPTATTTFNQATGGSWGTCHGFIVMADSSTSTNTSNYIAYGLLSSDVTINQNDTVEFATSALTFTLG